MILQAKLQNRHPTETRAILSKRSSKNVYLHIRAAQTVWSTKRHTIHCWFMFYHSCRCLPHQESSWKLWHVGESLKRSHRVTSFKVLSMSCKITATLWNPKPHVVSETASAKLGLCLRVEATPCETMGCSSPSKHSGMAWRAPPNNSNFTSRRKCCDLTAFTTSLPVCSLSCFYLLLNRHFKVLVPESFTETKEN